MDSEWTSASKWISYNGLRRLVKGYINCIALRESMYLFTLIKVTSQLKRTHSPLSSKCLRSIPAKSSILKWLAISFCKFLKPQFGCKLNRTFTSAKVALLLKAPPSPKLPPRPLFFRKERGLHLIWMLADSSLNLGSCKKVWFLLIPGMQYFCFAAGSTQHPARVFYY